jgi:hypothetical protein
MKKLVFILLAAVAGVLVYRQFFAQPSPVQQRTTAQESADGVVGYWLTALREKREFDMNSVCHDAARLESKAVIDALRREEDRRKTICSATTHAPTSEAGTFRATLSAGEATLMNLRLRAGERDGKYWIYEVAQE